MDIGEAITVGGVYVSAMIAIWVWVGLTCEVKVATEPAGFWSVVWVGELDMPDRLQAEITVTSKRDIDRSLKIFNFAFTIAMKIYSRQFVFVTLIIYKTLPRRIHRAGSVCLRHLGDIYPTLPWHCPPGQVCVALPLRCASGISCVGCTSSRCPSGVQVSEAEW